MKTTLEELKEYINTLPEGQAEIFYRTKYIEFLCRKIDELKEQKMTKTLAEEIRLPRERLAEHPEWGLGYWFTYLGAKALKTTLNIKAEINEVKVHEGWQVELRLNEENDTIIYKESQLKPKQGE